MIGNGGPSIIDEKFKCSIWCWCGEEITKYSIGSGRTPYGIYCSNCKTSLHNIMPSGVGWHLNIEHAIEAWNDYCDAIIALKGDGFFRPSEKLVREYMYRQAKGWGQNPA